jgi:hypothetical protein
MRRNVAVLALMQTTTSTSVLTRNTYLRLGMILRAQQRPPSEGSMPNPTCSAASRTSAHGSPHGALARPEDRRTGTELGDALDACCAYAQEMDAGELGTGGLERWVRVVESVGVGGGAGRRWTDRGRARKRAWWRDQSVSCHCCECERVGVGRAMEHTMMISSEGCFDGRGCGWEPYRPHKRSDNEQHKANTTPRLTRGPAHRRRQGVREQSGKESVECVVCLRHAS